MTPRLLAAKAVMTVLMSGLFLALPARAGIPVIDAANLTQTIMTALEAVAQTLKQIEQYRTQLQQYENQLQNSLAPAAFVWDQAQATVSGLMNATNTLNQYKNQLGSIDAYLAKYQDVAQYRNSTCFSATGCTASEWEAMQKNREIASESQKKANDALFRGIDQQQSNLQNDAFKLQTLQTHAQAASGQMQAIGFANQLASQQAHQLLQIRGLLLAQQNAVAAKMSSDADTEALQKAARAASMAPRIAPTAKPKNWLDLIH